MTQYRIADDLRSTPDENGAVVLDIHEGQMFTLNVVASRIFEALKNGPGCSESEVIEKIVREFGIDPKEAENDIREFLQNLRHHRLVEALPSKNET